MVQMKLAAMLLLLLLAAARCSDAAPTDHNEHDEEMEEKEHEEVDEEVHKMHGRSCEEECPDEDCETTITVPEVCCPICLSHKLNSSESLSSESDESAECASIRCLPPDCTSPVKPPGICCYVCL